MDYTEIIAETYSGYKIDEYPLRFFLIDRWYEVVDIEDRWYSPGYSYFKVFCDDAHNYMLKYDETKELWEAKRIPKTGQE